MYEFILTNNTTIYITNTHELKIFYYIEDLYKISNIKTLYSYRYSYLVDRLQKEYNFTLHIKDRSITNNNKDEYVKLKLFLLDKLYVPKLNILYMLNNKHYNDLLIEYVNNRSKHDIIKLNFANITNLLKLDIFTNLNKCPNYSYKLDLMYLNTVNLSNPKTSEAEYFNTTDLNRFIYMHKLYSLTPELFYLIYKTIYTNNIFSNKYHEIYYIFEKNASLIMFDFDFVSLKINLIYKNKSPTKIFKTVLPNLKPHNRIENRYIFMYMDRFYSINVYEYYPYITTYLKLRYHVFNYLKLKNAIHSSN